MVHFSWSPPVPPARPTATAPVCAVSACWIRAFTFGKIARHCGHTSLPAGTPLGAARATGCAVAAEFLLESDVSGCAD
ncbi:hypothetical protein GQ600_27551 [Phytophthora cactorum]|nr:hypothetical protein GQ600_27551 [Phytophthora cactorum]